MRKIRKLKTQAASVEAAVSPKPEKERRIRRSECLSTGSTLLNLACTDHHYGGFLKGKYYYLVGDSSSGKTFLSMTCLAEATINPAFKHYRLIYDNIEDGCLLDLKKLFNAEVAKRIEPPASEDGVPVYSSTIEELYYNVDDAAQKALKEGGRPFIYILDSMDALTSKAQEEKFDEQKKAHRAGKDAAGSYGDGKAKSNSENLRKVLKTLRQTGSILIIVSQTRDNLGFGFEKKTRSGGRALKFYATIEVWSSVIKTIKKTVKGKPRKVGVRISLELKKNRVTGKLAEVQVDIYPSYGIDDTGSLVDYLIEEGWWKKSKGSIVAKHFGMSASRDALIRQIESQGKVAELRALAGQCWREIDEACSVKRQGRYSKGD